MRIQPFDTSALEQNSLWFLLKNNYSEEITVVRPTAAGPEPYVDCNAYRMRDGSVLLGFPNAFKTVFAQGLAVIGDGTTEYVTTQAYERVEHLLTIAPPNDNLGTFVFTDSQPVPSTLDWRCDVAYYGPMPFPDFNGERINPTEDKSVLVVFEPIISVSGLAHLVYLRRDNFEEGRNNYLNNSLTPFTTATMGECFKLIHEWSLVAQEPFNNTEDVAQSARQFCQIVGITDELVAPYPDMQIANFLSGAENARVRPESIVAPTNELISFVRERMSSLSLSRIISHHPDAWDIAEVASKEQDSIELRKKDFFHTLTKSEYPEDGNISPILVRAASFVYEPWFEAFDKAREFSKALV